MKMLQNLTRTPIQKVLLVIVAILSIILQSPQPQVDWTYYSKLASAHTTNNNNNNNDDMPLRDVKIVITGATSGLGLSLSKKLHSLGGTIIAVGRSKSKLDALEKILQQQQQQQQASAEEKNTKGGKVVPILADFQDLDSVSSAAQEIQDRFSSVDFLINNAGMMYSSHVGGEEIKLDRTSPQGFDVAFSVNYLSHFLLTEELLPSLEKSTIPSEPRIIQISSSMHMQVSGEDLVPVPVSSDDNQVHPLASQPSASRLHSLRAYGNSKLAQIYHGRSLTREVEKDASSSLRIISICPSWVATKIVGGPGFKQVLDLLAFDAENYGLTSILYAMFHPDAGAKEKANGGMSDERYNDFVANSNFIQYALKIPGMKHLNSYDSPQGMRLIITWTGAMFHMWIQRFFATVGFVPTSDESYNVAKQDALYKWSKAAIDPWRKN